MKKKSIESKIRLSAILIYLFAALTGGGVVFYFYAIGRNIDLRKETMSGYHGERQQVHDLIEAVNEAQAAVNLYVVTRNARYYRQYREKSQEIDARMDSLVIARSIPRIDSVLSEVTGLLKRKEEAIVLLNRQFNSSTPIDSLPQRLSLLTSALQENASETDTDGPIEFIVPEYEALLDEEPDTGAGSPRRGFFRGIFSTRKTVTEESPAEVTQEPAFTPDPALTPVPDPRPDRLEPVLDEDIPFGGDSLGGRDTTLINRFVEQTREEYGQHLTAIGNQVNSIILADQQINSRITLLLTRLYSRIVNLRMEELETDQVLIRRNNTVLWIIGGVALLSILGLLILILRYVNRGYADRRKLEEADRRNRQLIESRHKLLLSVSHDVKTPLNSMLGYADLYQQNGVLNREETAPIRNAGSHILDLLNNLLQFSGLEKGTVTLAPVHFGLAELCTGVCEMFAPLTRQKSLAFDFRTEVDPELVLYSDPLKIKQVLTNLLSNAVKYTATGGIVFEVGYRESVVEFRISDTGAGIPPEKRKKLFQPFSRIEENSGAEEGTGYGLYVVKGLVDLFGGSISVWSEPGQGSRFSVRLPVHPGEKIVPDTATGNIWLIDDDRAYLELLAGWCRRMGHTVTVCSCREEFEAELARVGSFDWVLTDMELGDFTGEDVLRHIRAGHAEIPVVLVSGRADYGEEAVLAKGFSGFLPKPVSFADLYRTLGGKAESVSGGPLSAFLGEDPAATEDLLIRFFGDTVDHLLILRDAVRSRDFAKCRYICHKMGPMFRQLEAPERITALLKKVDGLPEGEDSIAEEMIRDLEELPASVEKFLEKLREKYLPD